MSCQQGVCRADRMPASSTHFVLNLHKANNAKATPTLTTKPGHNWMLALSCSSISCKIGRGTGVGAAVGIGVGATDGNGVGAGGVGAALGEGVGFAGDGLGLGVADGIGLGIGLGLGVGLYGITSPCSLMEPTTVLVTGLTSSTVSSASIEATEKDTSSAFAGAIAVRASTTAFCSCVGVTSFKA